MAASALDKEDKFDTGQVSLEGSALAEPDEGDEFLNNALYTQTQTFTRNALAASQDGTSTHRRSQHAVTKQRKSLW